VGAFHRYPERYSSLIAHYDGKSWQQVNAPRAGSGYEDFLYGVHGSASDDVWAVGYSEDSTSGRYSTLVLHYDGQVWSMMPSPNPSPSNYNYLYGVTALAADNAWAVGYYDDNAPGGSYDATLLLHWDGSRWSQVESPSPYLRDAGINWLYSISASAPDDIWAFGYGGVGEGGFQPLALHWDGSIWRLVPTPGVPGTAFTTAIHAVSRTEVWAAGSYLESAFPYRYLTLVMRWDGEGWKVIPSPNPGSRSNMLRTLVVTHGDVWVAGDYTNACSPCYAQTLTMRYRGGNWEMVPSPNPGNLKNRLTSLSAIGDTLWAVGYSDKGQYDYWWSTITQALRFDYPARDMAPAAVVSGQWSVVSGQWSVVSGQWSVVSGQWSVVSGQWSVVSGQWSVVSGQYCH
jgi:hypothetical protein